jgi:hypothetical protein
MSETPAELPGNGPATLGGVKIELGIAEDDERSDDQLTAVVNAVNAQICGHGDSGQAWPCTIVARGSESWGALDTADLELGANRLAVRLWQRRNSPMGYEVQGGELPVYVMRNDPDLAMLLGLGHWQPPKYQVG